jgi:hypothetical protein
MKRAAALRTPADRGSGELGYGRVLRLLDLTVETRSKPTFRRELLRWRDLVAALYLAGEVEPVAHDEAFRCLLRFTPEASRQLRCLSVGAGRSVPLRRAVRAKPAGSHPFGRTRSWKGG